MPFGIVGRTGPGMRQVVGFGDRSTGKGTFVGKFGVRHCPKGPIGRTCATAPRRGPLPKLLVIIRGLAIIALRKSMINNDIIIIQHKNVFHPHHKSTQKQS